MTYYIENIYICLAAPLLVSVLYLRGKKQASMIFLLVGMTVCLLSSYISTFAAAVLHTTLVMASVEITPIIEESMKLLPILFYLMVFEPKKEQAADEVIVSAIGFATFENVCYLLTNGAADTLHLIIRGLGPGTMHLVCGMIVAVGLLTMWDRLYLRIAGTIGLLCVAMTYHAIYNLLVTQAGVAAEIGYLIPIVTAGFILMFRQKISRHLKAS
ncbi:MAG: PrsW family intramembrane metalloprotease [Oscillospiraceae bacterium]|nr:PrsW family intramembrane metalloprotease [Oscillospiraceae bacterium]